MMSADFTKLGVSNLVLHCSWPHTADGHHFRSGYQRCPLKQQYEGLISNTVHISITMVTHVVLSKQQYERLISNTVHISITMDTHVVLSNKTVWGVDIQYCSYQYNYGYPCCPLKTTVWGVDIQYCLYQYNYGYPCCPLKTTVWGVDIQYCSYQYNYGYPCCPLKTTVWGVDIQYCSYQYNYGYPCCPLKTTVWGVDIQYCSYQYNQLRFLLLFTLVSQDLNYIQMICLQNFLSSFSKIMIMSL